MYNRRSFRSTRTKEQRNDPYTRVRVSDPELYGYIIKEENRQMQKIELIASENFASETVLEVAGTVLTDKYAEGYPGKRYYGGCEYVDMIENLARERAKKLFKADYVNVQPHSGSNANMAVYFTLLNHGDTILGMDLAQGGHLTHGLSVNFSGKFYNALSYGVSRESERIDYDAVEKIAREHKPKLIIAGASSYSRIIDFERFRHIADSVGAFFMADIAHIAGLVAVGLHPSPLPHAHFVTTTTHKTLRGPRGGLILIGTDGENTLGVHTVGGKTKKWGELIDSAVMPGLQGGPLMHIIAAKAAACAEALSPVFAQYQKQVLKNASCLASCFEDHGMRLVSGGTDNHLMLLDLSDLDMTGKNAEAILDQANITVNKNVIPYDTKSPFVTSGIRIGTPAVTTRGMKEPHMKQIADFIVRALRNGNDQNTITRIAGEVYEFTRSFPRHEVSREFYV